MDLEQMQQKRLCLLFKLTFTIIRPICRLVEGSLLINNYYFQTYMAGEFFLI